MIPADYPVKHLFTYVPFQHLASAHDFPHSRVSNHTLGEEVLDDEEVSVVEDPDDPDASWLELLSSSSLLSPLPPRWRLQFRETFGVARRKVTPWQQTVGSQW